VLYYLLDKALTSYIRYCFYITIILHVKGDNVFHLVVFKLKP